MKLHLDGYKLSVSLGKVPCVRDIRDVGDYVARDFILLLFRCVIELQQRVEQLERGE